MAEEEESGEGEGGQREKILRVRWRGKRSLKRLWGRAVLSADLQEASTPPRKKVTPSMHGYIQIKLYVLTPAILLGS